MTETHSSKLNILIVDDDAFIRQIISRVMELEDINIESTCVEDGREALTYLQNRRGSNTKALSFPDLVLLDIEMPKLNGIETLRQIKSNPTMSSINVVMFSATYEPSVIDECIEMGAIGYITKPKELKDFADALHSLRSLWPDIAGWAEGLV